MPVIISMSLAVLIWSLYPLAAAIGLEQMSSLEMIFYVYFFASSGAILMSVFYLIAQKKWNEALEIQKNLPIQAYMMIIASGISGALAHCFFIVALSLAHKGGVSLLFESWPIFAMIATPFLMKKQWKEVSFKEFLISIIALIGVAIIILSDSELKSDSNSVGGFDMAVLGGYILAFAGGYLCAVVAVTQGAYAEYFGKMKDDFASTTIAQMLGRTISFIIVIFVFIGFNDGNASEKLFLWPAAYIGFGVFALGGALYNYGLLNSDRPTIHIVYYFVPIFAVIWLYFAGEATLNLGLVIGGLVVVIANIYLTIVSRKAKMSTPLV